MTQGLALQGPASWQVHKGHGNIQLIRVHHAENHVTTVGLNTFKIILSKSLLMLQTASKQKHRSAWCSDLITL